MKDRENDPEERDLYVHLKVRDRERQKIYKNIND